MPKKTLIQKLASDAIINQAYASGSIRIKLRWAKLIRVLIFWGVPLTTQIKDKPYYHKFTFKGKLECALLTQLRLLDANRLTRRIGCLGMREFEAMKKELSDYLK